MTMGELRTVASPMGLGGVPCGVEGADGSAFMMVCTVKESLGLCNVESIAHIPTCENE